MLTPSMVGANREALGRQLRLSHLLDGSSRRPTMTHRPRINEREQPSRVKFVAERHITRRAVGGPALGGLASIGLGVRDAARGDPIITTAEPDAPDHRRVAGQVLSLCRSRTLHGRVVGGAATDQERHAAYPGGFVNFAGVCQVKARSPSRDCITSKRTRPTKLARRCWHSCSEFAPRPHSCEM